ncbi:DUF202 domain-containing protein [Geodermatophilus sp. SYSU D00684]
MSRHGAGGRRRGRTARCQVSRPAHLDWPGAARVRVRRGPRPPHPDHRFTLANERILLAWLRTGLALVAGGVAVAVAVAVAAYVPRLGASWGGGAVGLALVATGLGTAPAGYRRWRRNERAIATDAPLRAGPEVPALVALVSAVVLLVAVLLVVEVA